MANTLPTVHQLLTQTKRLERDLANLTKKYPEDHLQPDSRIFNRVLTTDWRYSSELYGPLERRYVDAASWVDRFHCYLNKLREYCTYMESPERFGNLPLNCNRRTSAADCLRLLTLQSGMLARWSAEERSGAKDSELEDLRSGLGQIAKTKGLKQTAAELGVNRETLSDIIATRTTKPHRETRMKLRRYIQGHKSSK